jgi:hypothetical protein
VELELREIVNIHQENELARAALLPALSSQPPSQESFQIYILATGIFGPPGSVIILWIRGSRFFHLEAKRIVFYIILTSE